MQLKKTNYSETLVSTPTKHLLLLNYIAVLIESFFLISPSTWLCLTITFFEDSCTLISPDLSMSWKKVSIFGTQKLLGIDNNLIWGLDANIFFAHQIDGHRVLVCVACWMRVMPFVTLENNRKLWFSHRKRACNKNLCTLHPTLFLSVKSPGINYMNWY